jgi:hypothetical protein
LTNNWSFFLTTRGEKWFAKFKRDEMSIKDDARSVRPKEAVTDENIKKVYKIILNNRKVK